MGGRCLAQGLAHGGLKHLVIFSERRGELASRPAHPRILEGVLWSVIETGERSCVSLRGGPLARRWVFL